MRKLGSAVTAALFVGSGALFAQEPQRPDLDPPPATTPETARDPQTMTPETANDPQVMVPESAQDPQVMVPEDAKDTTSSREVRGAGTGQTATQQQQSTTTQPPTQPQPTVTTPPPPPTPPTQTAAVSPPDTQSGCWVRLYEQANFSGNSFTLIGPADIRDMEGHFRSVEVGPNATLLTFDEENFQIQRAQFTAGQRVPTVDHRADQDEFESLRVTCSAGGAG